MAQRIIDRSYVGEVLQHIYASRLNVRLVVSVTDGYFYLENMDKRIPLRGTSIEEAVTHLAHQLAIEFPESQFSIWWHNNFMREDQPG